MKNIWRIYIVYHLVFLKGEIIPKWMTLLILFCQFVISEIIFEFSQKKLFDRDSQVYQMGSVWRTYTLKNLKILSRAKKNDTVLSYKISLHFKDKERFVGLK